MLNNIGASLDPCGTPLNLTIGVSRDSTVEALIPPQKNRSLISLETSKNASFEASIKFRVRRDEAISSVN